MNPGREYRALFFGLFLGVLIGVGGKDTFLVKPEKINFNDLPPAEQIEIHKTWADFNRERLTGKN